MSHETPHQRAIGDHWQGTTPKATNGQQNEKNNYNFQFGAFRCDIVRKQNRH
jgi:hypothetical protein